MPQQPTSPVPPPPVSQEVVKPVPRKRNPALSWLFRLAGTALLLFFLWRLDLDPAKVGEELLGANMWLVAASVLLVFPLIALKAWRWHTILKDLGIPVSFDRAYRLYAFGMAAGSLTPGQAGDFIKAWNLNQDGYSLSTALLSNVLDRLFDIAVLVLLASSGLLLLGSDFLSLLPALLALLLGLTAGLVILSIPSWRDKLVGMALRIVMRRKSEVAEPETGLRPVRFFRVFVLTLAATALVLFRVWLLALALGLNLNFLELVAASSLATVAALIPISIGGIGTRDFALKAILAKIGYSAEKAVSLSTFILLLQVVNLGAGYLVWATRPSEEKDLGGKS